MISGNDQPLGDGSEELPKPQQHPELTEEQLAAQRGNDPQNPVGTRPPRPVDPDPDSGWTPNPDRSREWESLAREISKEHRPKHEDVFPHLLIRAMTPGDRGQRPLWPPVVCWESPDILLMDASYTGPIDPSRFVGNPEAGRTYRVVVRVFNLGLLSAVGVYLQVWAVQPGFIGAGNQDDPYYEAHKIGVHVRDVIADRTRPEAVAYLELDTPWTIDPTDFGHWCMIASVTCPADHFDGPLLVNNDRHVGQRNLDILGPDDDAKALLFGLGTLVPEGFTLEITHGGPAVLPLLRGFVARKQTRGIEPVMLEEVRGGVDLGSSAHLLTIFQEDGRTVAIRSRDLEKLALRGRHAEFRKREEVDLHPFALAGGTRRLIEQLGPARLDGAGIVTDAPLAETLLEVIAGQFADGGLDARSLARGLGGTENAAHLLRFTLTEPDGGFVGGYSMVISPQAIE